MELFSIRIQRTFQLVSTCIGNPQSRGIPTWFVLPDDMMFSEKFSGAMQRLDELRKGK